MKPCSCKSFSACKFCRPEIFATLDLPDGWYEEQQEKQLDTVEAEIGEEIENLLRGKVNPYLSMQSLRLRCEMLKAKRPNSKLLSDVRVENTLLEAKHLYYCEGTPTMDDVQYDLLERIFLILHPDSKVKGVGCVLCGENI